MDRKDIYKWVLLVVLVCASMAIVWPLNERVRLGLDLKGGTSYVVEIDESAIEAQLREEGKDLTEEQIQSRLPEAKQHAQKRALEVIRNRVDGLGIAEPIIYPEKGNRIVVQLPGADETKREEAARAIQSVAFLEFRLVAEENESLVGRLFETGAAPEGYRIARIEERGAGREYYVRDPQSVPDAAMDREFRQKLSTFRAPPGHILVLRAGALPAPLRVLEERSVDPTLGTDSIESGWRAAAIGFGAVAVFMAIYYHFAGWWRCWRCC
jgi:preprotein translocase subunit SecD